MSRAASSTVDTSRTRELVEANPRTRLIDVRTPGEFAAARIPGSHNVPLDVLREHRSVLSVAHEDPCVLVCASGARADQARTVLEAAGLERISVLRGGVTAWERDGAPVAQGSGVWAMERQVRLSAGLLVLIGVLGSLAYRPLKWLAGFIGAGLTFSAISNTCAMARVLSLLPHNRVRAGEAQTLLAALTERDAPASPSSR